MAKVTYVDLLPAEAEAFYRSLNIQDRFVAARVAKKNQLISKKRVKGLTQRSLLPQIAALWNGLTTGQKDAWTAAGAECGLNGYRLFVQDTAARIMNEISGVATPSLLHQSWVGALVISDPATEIKIAQLHPEHYWVSKKVYGKKGQYEPVLVQESFSLPLTIGLNYKSDLESVAGGSFAKFFAEIWSSYQGVDRFTEVSLPLDYVADWQADEVVCSSVIGHVIGYAIYFHLFNVQGTLKIDNIRAEHSGQNWVRDPFCKDIQQGFTRAFYQVPKHWAAEILPSGADFETIYLN